MNYIESAYKLAEDICRNPKYVFQCQDVKGQCEHSWIAFDISEQEDTWWGMPSNIEAGDIKRLIIYELLACSINYCYWYGNPNIRPNGSSSTKLYKIMDEAFSPENNVSTYGDDFWERQIGMWLIVIECRMVEERFPLLKERWDHLRKTKALDIVANTIHQTIQEDKMDENKLHALYGAIMKNIPSYCDDLFLKRVSLFFIMLYRRMGLLKDVIHLIPCPIDYHIPNMLRHYQLIRYNEELAGVIERKELIPKCSRMETEIRAASLLMTRKVAEACDTTPTDVDTFLFLNRKKAETPFHLTITTDY